jgi:hypothetical protein
MSERDPMSGAPPRGKPEPSGNGEPGGEALERILREDAARTLAEADFTAHVMAALPAPASRAPAWLRPALVLGAAALGCGLAVALAPAGLEPLRGFADLARARTFTPDAIAALVTAATLLVCAVVLASDEA